MHAYSTPGTTTTPDQSLLVNLGLTADPQTPTPQYNVLFRLQSSVPIQISRLDLLLYLLRVFMTNIYHN
jgi:hypothetical protein